MTNDQCPMGCILASNDRKIRDGANGRPVYDLKERTSLFGENVIRFCKKVPVNAVTVRLIRQLVGCGTSVGANYQEADEAESKRDFRHKICICRKEANETKYFIRMIVTAVPRLRDAAVLLWQEARELHLIFCQIINSCDKRLKTRKL